MKYPIASTLFVAAIIALVGCSEKSAPSWQAKGRGAPAVRVEEVHSGAISQRLELTGSVKATRIARMGSPAEGPVMDCQIREGDTVQAGQVLLTIGRKKAADALVEASRDALTREQQDLARIQTLVQSGAVAADELEIAALRLSRAQADLSKALESVEDYKIRVPWDGIVSKVFVTDGYYVAPREHLIEIFDPASTVIEFAIPESQAAIVHKGMPVEVELDAYPGNPLQGEITRIYPELSPRTRTRTAEATIRGENSITLLPGMFARLRLVLDTVDNAVLVPEKAIVVTAAGHHRVFVVNDEKVKSHIVKTGIEDGRRVQIVEGLQPGEHVVTEGNERLRDGASVRIIGTSPKPKEN